MKRFFFALAFFISTSCSSISSQEKLTEDSFGVFVSSFESYGHSMYSQELLGYQKWSWLASASHRPVTYKIDVVVYRGHDLADVKKSFPILPGKEQDYRYLEYTVASKYFENTIAVLEKEIASEDDVSSRNSLYAVINPVLKTAYLLEKKFGK